MSRYLEDLFDQIDASVFSGDSLYDKDEIERFEHFLKRWKKESEEIRRRIEENENM